MSGLMAALLVEVVGRDRGLDPDPVQRAMVVLGEGRGHVDTGGDLIDGLVVVVFHSGSWMVVMVVVVLTGDPVNESGVTPTPAPVVGSPTGEVLTRTRSG